MSNCCSFANYSFNLSILPPLRKDLLRYSVIELLLPDSKQSREEPHFLKSYNQNPLTQTHISYKPFLILSEIPHTSLLTEIHPTYSNTGVFLVVFGGKEYRDVHRKKKITLVSGQWLSLRIEEERRAGRENLN